MLIRSEPAARLRAVMESELRAAFDAGFWAWPNADAPSREATREQYVAGRLALLLVEATKDENASNLDPSGPLADLRIRAEQLKAEADQFRLDWKFEPDYRWHSLMGELAAVAGDLLDALREQAQEIDKLKQTVNELDRNDERMTADLAAVRSERFQAEAALHLARQERDEYLALNRELVKRALPVETLDRERQITHLTNELATAEATLTRLQSGHQEVIAEMRELVARGEHAHGLTVVRWMTRLAVLTEEQP